MQVEHNLIDTIYRCDTLHFRLTDDYGKWLGSGTGGLHQISLPYKSDIPLDTSRLYILQIKQIMKDDPLIGVEKVGIKIIEKI
jgi:gliding motility-associated lipoprotein GldH